jgi:membrane fusion protein, multidrug efflux system
MNQQTVKELAMKKQDHRQTRRRVWTSATLAIAIAASLAAVFGLQANAKSTPAASAPPPPTPVSVSTVVQRDVAAWDEFSGRLEAVERVDIRARVSGTLQAVHFREGALVKPGDLLFTIDPAPYAAEADRAQAQLVAAQARLSFTASELERARRLWDERAIAQREFDERQNAQREADANLRAAQAALQSARLSLGYTQVRAPVAGRVGRLEVTVGNLVAAGPSSPVLTTLVSVSPIYASFEANEQVVTRALKDLNGTPSIGTRLPLERIAVQMGTAGTPDLPYRGHLQLVDNQVDAKSGTVRVRAVFDNKDGALIPGQFARLQLGQVKPESAVLISERAVGTDQNKKYVMVIDADSKAQYREVTLGAHVNGMRIVQAGLKADERIVVNGLQRVRPGALVAPQLVPMDAKADTAAPREASKPS